MLFAKQAPDGFVKSAICKAHEPGKGEAYFLYVEPLRGEVQRSRWPFYESVKLVYQISERNDSTTIPAPVTT